MDLADDIKHEYFVIDNLRPSHGYKFRVAAANQFGWSIPSIPSPIAMTPSTGASKAEFYDSLQMLQVRMRSLLVLLNNGSDFVLFFAIATITVGDSLTSNWPASVKARLPGKGKEGKRGRNLGRRNSHPRRVHGC